VFKGLIFRASKTRRLIGVHKITYVVNKVALLPNKWLLEYNWFEVFFFWGLRFFTKRLCKE